MPWTFPNILTLLRVLLVPLALFLHAKGLFLSGFLILVAGVLTDFLDGHFARKWGQETHFGAIFDPIADKLVALSCYSYIGLQELAPFWFVGILLLRNFAQLMSVPILIWWLKRAFYVRPSRFAKWATGISDAFLFLPLFLPHMSKGLLFPLMILLAACELFILFTYLPRLYAIAVGTHDTFT